MTTPEPTSSADLEAELAKHYIEVWPSGRTFCRECQNTWPCLAQRLQAQVADLQRQVEGRVTVAEEIQRRHDAVASLRADLEHTRQIVGAQAEAIVVARKDGIKRGTELAVETLEELFQKPEFTTQERADGMKIVDMFRLGLAMAGVHLARLDAGFE